MATSSAKKPQGEQETKGGASEAKKILIKALLRFLSLWPEVSTQIDLSLPVLAESRQSGVLVLGRPWAISRLQSGPYNTLLAPFQLSEIILVQL